MKLIFKPAALLNFQIKNPLITKTIYSFQMPPKKKKVEESSTEPAQNPEPEKQSNDLKWKWSKTESLIHGDCEAQSNTKIIGFDMDDTLIKTKSGAKFPKDSSDWQFWDPSVPKKIKEHFDKGFKIVIFTNQNGISKGHTTEKDIKKKIENISGFFGCPIQAVIASADDKYRKPSLELWRFFEKNLNGGLTIDLAQSTFCGDAAGRVGKKKDFTDTDYKFALNVGLKFATPEEFFLGQKEKIPSPEFNPKDLIKKGKLADQVEKKTYAKPNGSKDMILFVGSPASGKSTFWQNHLKEYVRVNRDTLKTKEKCLKVADETMSSDKNLVIDNTNPTPEDRKPYIELAKKYNYNVRAIFFNVEKSMAFHLDTLRELNIHRSHLSDRVGSIPIHTWYKNCQKPDKKEGFAEVIEVEFIAGPFNNKNDEEIFFSFVRGK